MADGGAAPERTALAWQRTALAVVVAALAVLRLAAVRGSAAGVAVASVAGVLAVVAVLRVRVGYARAGDAAPQVPMGPALVTATSIAILGCAAAASVLA